MSCNCNDNNESNATDCADECPNTCNTQIFVSNPCGCNTGCGCNPSTPGTAVPYYNAAEGCEESHKRVCIQSQYVTGVSISNNFVMPACNETAVLTIPGLQLINIGVYLWNPTYGYLKVTAFDFASSTITVTNECNVGNAAPGTSIPACTVFTVLAAPATLAANPCDAVAVSEGSILVCNAGEAAPLEATSNGQVPVVTDVATNTVEFQTLDITPRVCTELTQPLILLTGNAGPYLITVTDNTYFVTGTLVQIGGRTDRFTVIMQIAGVAFTATVDPVPGVNVTIPVGTAVCYAPCCEIISHNLDEYITNPCSWDLSPRMTCDSFFGNTGDRLVDHIVSIADGGIDNDIILDRTVQNTTCREMQAVVDLTYEVYGGFECNSGDYGNILMSPKFGYLTGPGALGVPVLSTVTQVRRHEAFHLAGTIVPSDLVYNSYHYHATYNIYVLAGENLRFRVGLYFALEAGTGALKYQIKQMVDMYGLFYLAI